jgi:hypothetical protein
MSASEAFNCFLDVMLPGDGYAVTFTQVFIDESYDDDRPPLLVVAGYLFRKRKASEFTRKWAAYLERKGLPYFHMSECAHGEGVFKGKDCDAVARELIRRTRQDTEFGVAIAINEDEFAKHVGPREGVPTAYSLALLLCMHHFLNWKLRNNENGKTAFFFEEGHKHQGDAHKFITWMLKHDGLREAMGYSGHAFLPKATPGLHPADNLAWHWRLETRRRGIPNRKPVRADLKALTRPTDVHVEYTPHRLEMLGKNLERQEIERHSLIRLSLETGVELVPNVLTASQIRAARRR